MKCLSIRQPWAWLILHAGKDIENRGRRCGYRGPLLIHAARQWDFWPEHWPALWADLRGVPGIARTLPDRIPSPDDEVQRGGIVGRVELIDCVSRSNSPWFSGPYGLILLNPEPVRLFPCRGYPGLFSVDLP